MEKLDSFALNIEFLLISVVQGVALAALAAAAINPVSNLQFEYALYIVSSFMLILNFWSQAIIHAVSFIDWPLDLPHNFLYFLASFIEVMAFAFLTEPTHWFVFMSAFLLIAMVLYYVDLKMIKNREAKFEKTKQKDLYKHILDQHVFEFKFMLPAGVVYTVICVLLLIFMKNIFIDQKFHVLLIAFQTLFTFYIMISSIKSFKQRSKLLTQKILSK